MMFLIIMKNSFDTFIFLWIIYFFILLVLSFGEYILQTHLDLPNWSLKLDIDFPPHTKTGLKQHEMKHEYQPAGLWLDGGAKSAL